MAPDGSADQTIGQGGPVSLTVPLGGSGVDSPGDAPATGGTVELVTDSNVDAGGGTFVFTDTQLPDNPDGAAVQTEITNFGADDEIRISQVADQGNVQVRSLTSDGGRTEFDYTSAEGTVFQVTLVGVSGANFFTVNDFNGDPNLGDVTFV